MKITTKTTKEQLTSFLEESLKNLTDSNLKDRIKYALVAEEDKVTKKDLSDLVKEVVKSVAGEQKAKQKAEPKAQPKAENSVKKPIKKKVEVPEESAESEETAEETEAPAKEEKPKKSKLGNKKPKKEKVASMEASKISVQMATMFPKTFEVRGAKYELAEDIKTMDDLYDALAKDEDIVFAYYWTKRHLKQFPYFSAMLGQPKSFDLDLDLAEVIYISEEKIVSYQLSLYTEAVYTIIPDDFEEVDGIRLANGIEFQIYRKFPLEATEESAE